MTFELLSKPACVQCTATERAFNPKGMVFRKKDVSLDPEALEAAKGLGYLQAPVVVVRDAENNIVDHWSGFRPEKIDLYA